MSLQKKLKLNPREGFTTEGAKRGKQMNRVQVSGILGCDPQLAYTEKGQPVCRFSIGIESKSEKNLWKNFHMVMLWGPKGEALPLQIVKGSRVMVSGRLGIQHWQYEGKTYTKTIILAESVQVLTDFSSEQGNMNFQNPKQEITKCKI